MAMDADGILAMLDALSSIDADKRKQAEEVYDKLTSDQKFSLLLPVIANSAVNLDVRSFCAILLRRHAIDLDVETGLSADHRRTVLQLYQTAADSSYSGALSRKICELVAELTNICTDQNGRCTWIELFQTMFEMAKSPQPKHKILMLTVLTENPQMFDTNMESYWEIIRQVLVAGLIDSDINVRIAAALAFANFCKHHWDNVATQESLRQNTGSFFSIAAESLYLVSDEPVVLRSLEDLLEEIPKVAKPYLASFGADCLKALANDQVTIVMKHTAIELLVTMAERLSPAFCRLFCPQYLSTFVHYLLMMMTDLADGEEDGGAKWEDMDEVEESDELSNASVGENSLDRLSIAIGARETQFLALVLEQIQAMLSTPEDDKSWCRKVGAVHALSSIAEGCSRRMMKMLDELVDVVLRYISDPHPRVRHAACNALGQFFEDLQPNIQKHKHSVILPPLLNTMKADSCDRVQAHAAAALVNFIEPCPVAVFKQYADDVAATIHHVLTSKLQTLQETRKHLVLEQSLTALFALADTLEDRFETYYSRFVEILKLILMEVINNPDCRILRGRVIECISLVGLAGGKERFLRDCQEVMNELVKIQIDFENLDEDEIEMSFLMSAWSRICTILGEDFAPYLPIVFEPVMKAAEFKPQFAMVRNDEVKALEHDADDWEFLSLTNQESFGIRTTGLEQKANACTLLSCYVRVLKDKFEPYVDRVAELMMNMLDFYFHDKVRIIAAETLPLLLDAVRGKDHKDFDLWQKIEAKLVPAMAKEMEPEVAGQMLLSLSAILEQLYPTTISPQDLQQITDAILSRLDICLKHCEKPDWSDDEDDQEPETTTEDDTESFVLSKVSDFIHTAFKLMQLDFLPYFDQLVPKLSLLLQSKCPQQDRQWTICCFDDLIEYTGEASVKYSKIFLPVMFEAIKNPEPQMRQAVTYGIGMMALIGSTHYTEFIRNCIEPMCQVIAEPDSRSEDNEMATENAISAVTKFMASSGCEQHHLETLVPMWLQWLPIYEDLDESEFVIGYLCHLMEEGNVMVLGQDNSNMVYLMSIFAKCLLNNGIDVNRQTIEKIAYLVRQIYENPHMKDCCISVLPADEQNAIQEMLTNQN